MTNKQKVLLCVLLGGVFVTASAILAAQKPVPVGPLVVVLVVNGIILFLAGYYAGLSRSD
jgi:fructose-specific phosphotransferase system IIC component